MPSAATASPSARATPKGRRTRERILDTAEALFAARGFAGTALRDVAEAVGLRIPSLYNHFAGKDALYEAVLERGLRPALELLEGTAAAAPLDRRAFVERVLGVLGRRPDMARLVQHEVLTGGERLPAALRAWVQTLFVRAEEALRVGPGAGHWSEEQIPLLVAALYQVAVGYFATAPLMGALRGEDWLSADALARQTRFFSELVATLLPDEDGARRATRAEGADRWT